jgi:hypothetical protein
MQLDHVMISELNFTSAKQAPIRGTMTNSHRRRLDLHFA